MMMLPTRTKALCFFFTACVWYGCSGLLWDGCGVELLGVSWLMWRVCVLYKEVVELGC